MRAVTPEHIMQLGLGFWSSKTLLSAVELGVFSALAKAPSDLETLQGQLGLHPRAARDFLDALVALKLLDRNDGIYSNTPEADLFLDRAKPSYFGGLLEMANARLYGFWGSLSEALRTGVDSLRVVAQRFSNVVDHGARGSQLLGSLVEARVIARELFYTLRSAADRSLS